MHRNPAWGFIFIFPIPRDKHHNHSAMTEQLSATAKEQPIALPDDNIAPEVVHDGYDEKISRIVDETGEVAKLALASGFASPEESKGVLRKIDLYILPMMAITYGKSSGCASCRRDAYRPTC